jgi:hypothetical protein
MAAMLAVFPRVPMHAYLFSDSVLQGHVYLHPNTPNQIRATLRPISKGVKYEFDRNRAVNYFPVSAHHGQHGRSADRQPAKKNGSQFLYIISFRAQPESR